MSSSKQTAHTPTSDSRERLIAELREERDTAIAEVERLRGVIEMARFISIEKINALPEAQGWWSAADANSGRIVKLIRAAISAATKEQQ
jgi:hypothetical protein